MTIDFKVGDRVRTKGGVALGRYNEGTLSEGIVVCLHKNGLIGVEFDENIEGHNCRSACKQGHGWFLYPKQLALVDDKPEQDQPNFHDIPFTIRKAQGDGWFIERGGSPVSAYTNVDDLLAAITLALKALK